MNPKTKNDNYYNELPMIVYNYLFWGLDFIPNIRF